MRVLLRTAAIVSLIVMLGLGTAPVHAQAVTDGEVVAFGQQIAGLLTSGQDEALVDLFEPQEITCPLSTPGGPQPICEGVKDGDKVSGYLGGVFGSDAGAATRSDEVAGLAALRAEIVGTPFQVLTFSRSGMQSGFLACASCWSLVISTEQEASGPLLGAQSPTVFEFQVKRAGSGLKIHSSVFGGVAGNPARLVGGVADGREFIRVNLGAPATGSGVARDEGAGSPRNIAVAGLAVVAVSVLLAASARRWRRR